MTLVRILDEFENSNCDRRPGGQDVASRFVCVSVLPSLNHNENPYSRASSVRELQIIFEIRTWKVEIINCKL